MTNSPDLNPLDYHVWRAMLECYKTFSTQAKYQWRAEDGGSTTELHQQGRIELYQKTSSLCESWDGHFEHVFK